MNILLIDDDPDTRTLARRAIVQEFPDAEINEAADEDGLGRVLASTALEILVSDYDLRWIDGFDVLKRVREKNPNCTAIMFTGTGNEELAVKALKAGFDDYVVKAPGQLKRLANSTRVSFERHQERQLLRDNRELLRRELYHRLHNNLQLVISLMQLTVKAIADEQAKHEIQSLMRRIQSLSALQEQLYQSEDLREIDLSVFTRRLLRDVENEFPDAIGSMELDSIVVSVDRAVPIALIFSETVTTAAERLQHGAQLKIRLQRQQGSAEFTIEGAANGREPSQLSSHLIARLAKQIDARIGGGQSPAMLTRVAFTI